MKKSFLSHMAFELFSKVLFVITILVMSILFSCSSSDNNSTPNISTILHDGVTREYILYVPDSYDEDSEVPLLFNFHGFGGTVNEFMNWADMRPLADTENFILVYPQGTLLNGNSHWNSGLESEDNKSSADDRGFIEALIDDISSNYSIDSDRIYACGYSNGAFFSYSLVCYLDDRIAAIGSVSGTMMDETYNNCDPSHPTSMINIHGTSDGVVPYGGGTGLKSIDDVISYWINFNSTEMTPTTNTVDNSGTRIERYSYTDGENDTSVEHYKIIGGGHVWFDISYNGSNTGRLIWDFVSRYDINGSR